LFNPGFMVHYRESLYAFSHYLLGNTDLTNHLVGYPPIHQHHFHLFGSGIPNTQTLNNHGDNQCHRDQGGVNCLSRAAPNGYAWILRDRIGLYTEFNDVRNVRAAALMTHVTAAWRLIQPIQQVRQLVMWMPSFFPYKSPALFTSSRRGTFEIDTNQEYVGWTEHHMPNEVQDVIEAYLHTHAEMLLDFWIFQGTSDRVFSNLSSVDESRDDLAVGASIDVAQNIRSRQFGHNPAELACSYMRSSRREMVGSQTYYRKAVCLIDVISRHLVMVIFIGRRRQVFPRASYRMHAFLRLYYSGHEGIAVVDPESNLSREAMHFSARHHADLLHDPNLLEGIRTASNTGAAHSDPIYIGLR